VMNTITKMPQQLKAASVHMLAASSWFL